jgi:hypothetical protein
MHVGGVIMPSPEQILNGLKEISNNWQFLAIIWHIYFAALVIGLIAGLRFPNSIMGILLGLPLLSVSAMAWVTSNPFNGTIFALVGLATIVVSIRSPKTKVRIGPTWALVAGLIMFVFGWLYPHFVEGSSPLRYLYSSPTGLIPCPTLSIVIGLGLVLAGLGSRTWSLILGVTGVFYGIFGAARLGVTIDWVLLLGAVSIVTLGFTKLPEETGVAVTDQSSSMKAEESSPKVM